MDGNSKEEFCTVCSVEVPSAFANEDEKNENKNVDKENCYNISKMISKWFMKIFIVLIILVFVYFLFKKT
jgi:cell division protein FtsL